MTDKALPERHKEPAASPVDWMNRRRLIFMVGELLELP
jgi:hypothetical protein